MMVCVQVLVLPAASVALQVRMMVPVPLQPPRLVTSVKVNVAVPQLSVAVAVPVAAGNVLVLHWTVTLEGHVIVGAVPSSTVTVKVQVAVLPFTSVAVAVTVVVPTGKELPLAGEKLVVTGPQLSDAVAV